MIENHTSEGDLRLLDVLRARGPLDRRTLATMTSTSPATLGRAIGRLARAGYVRERTVQATGRGRPPRVVELQPGAGSVVAVDAGASSLRAVLVDLEGRPRRRQTLPIGDRTDRDSLLRDLVQLVDRVIADAPRRPLAVAVGVSGIVDHAAGIVRLSPDLPGLTGVQLGPLLESRFGALCAIDNDDLLAAVGEATVGAAIGRRSVAYVSFGYGLGAGILIEGRPVRGASGGAGAIAYLAGGRIADAAAGHAIPARYAARANVATPVGWLDARTVAERATTGDKAAAATLDAAIVALAEGVVDVAALLDPEVIVLGGGVVAGSKRAFAAVEDALRVLPFPPPVVPSALGDDAVLQGAVALALALVRERAADVGPRSAKHRFATESLELVGRQPGPATASLEVSP